jgi:glycosyltransferase involved in cell wall biosynthesis
MPKVSIITTTLNAEKYLEKNIQSVISQNIDNLEHILVDGMSNDKTLEIVEKYKSHFSKVIIEKDRGIYDGMNKGILAAKGELVGILNSDDYYYDNRILNLVLSHYELSKKKDIIIYGDMFQDYKGARSFSRGDLSSLAFKKGKFQINHPTVFVAKSLYKKIGLFDISYPRGADREFLLRANYNKVFFLKINKPLTIFRLGGFTSLYNLKFLFEITKEEYRIFVKYYSKIFSIYKTFIQFCRYIKNYVVIKIVGQDKFLKNQIKRLNRKFNFIDK